MTLTAATLQQILLSLRSDTGRRFNEQRVNPRVGVRGRVVIVPLLANKSPLEVWVRDVSISGIGLLSAQHFPAGTRLCARFPKVDDQPLTLVYTVAHCKSVSKGLYVVGARLAEKPPELRRPAPKPRIAAKPASARPEPAAKGPAAKPATATRPGTAARPNMAQPQSAAIPAPAPAPATPAPAARIEPPKSQKDID